MDADLLRGLFRFWRKSRVTEQLVFLEWMDEDMYLTRLGRRCGAVLALLMICSTVEPAYALPPRVIAEGELLIISRDDAADSGTVTLATASTPADDDITRFLPQQKLDPLLVHPNYYTRDLEFQAQSIPRGRYLVVTNDPRTGCKCTVGVVLPDGAPVIVHRRYSITYVYPSERVVVDFGVFAQRKPRVLYRSGQGTFRTLHERIGSTASATKKFLVNLPVTGALSRNGRKVTDTGKGAMAAAGQVGTTYVDTVGKLLDGIPGVKTLEGLGQQLPARGHQEEIKRAGERAFRNAPEFIPTVR